MQHINVTLTSRRRKFYCATDANSDAESSIHEKRYQQCSLFILSSMLRIFSPPPAVAPEYVRSLKGEAASMFFLIHVYICNDTRTFLHQLTFSTSVCKCMYTYTHTHNCPLLRSLFSRTNIACISLECERVGQI